MSVRNEFKPSKQTVELSLFIQVQSWPSRGWAGNVQSISHSGIKEQESTMRVVQDFMAIVSDFAN